MASKRNKGGAKTRPKRGTNDGKRLEQLVAWIEQALREREGATITPNDHIADRDSGEMRQIDVSIRVPTGHDTLLVIVEVRDHARPVDTPYVESVATKRRSVGADVAYIVSRSGFYAPAVKKAQARSIRLLTLAEAPDHDWSAWCGFRHWGVVNKRYERTDLAVFGTDGVQIEIHGEVAAKFGADRHALVLTDLEGNPKVGGSGKSGPRVPEILATSLMDDLRSSTPMWRVR